jgi:hypothetical protein
VAPDTRIQILERQLDTARAEIAALRTSRDVWVRLCVSGSRPAVTSAPIAAADSANFYVDQREREMRRRGEDR